MLFSAFSVATSCGCLVLHFSRSRFSRWRDSEVSKALESLQLTGSEHFRCDENSEKIRERLHEKRQHFLKAVMTVWSATTEAYMLLGFLVQNYFLFGDVNQLPNILTAGACNFVFEELRKPAVPLTPQCMKRFTLIMTLATLAFTVGLPRELLPASYIARIVVGAVSGNAEFATKVNMVVGPFFVLSHHLQTEPDPLRAYSRLMFMLINEVVAVSLMAMAVSTLDSKEYQVEVAEVRLEEKVKELQEAEVSGYAAKRLLSVTCDAIVRLSDDLRVAEAGRSLADLLMCGLGFKNNSLEGVSFLRYVAPHDHARLRDFITESSKDDSTPRSLNLQLRDSNGIAFDSEIFHVSVPGLTDMREHLIGITQASADRRITSNVDLAELPDFNEACDTINELPQPDMRHILGYTLRKGKRKTSLNGGTETSRSDSSGSDAKRKYVRLKSLDRVNCVVRYVPNEDRLSFRSVKLTFSENSDAAPDLLQWIKPGYRGQFSAWVQSHVAETHVLACSRAEAPPLSELRLFSPSASAESLLVGSSKVVAMEDKRPVTGGEAPEAEAPEAEAEQSSSRLAASSLLLNIELRHLLAR